MQTLTIDPAVPYIIPPGPLTICLVGCGGTGSHIAQALARLAAHVRDTSGERLALHFFDGDTVEPKNVGRQLFGPQDCGKNKAQVLAARFSALFGLDITAYPVMFGPQNVMVAGQRFGVLVGAVDTAEARRTLVAQLRLNAWRLWLDCGNHEWSGQVCVGGSSSAADLATAFSLGSVCSALPAPSLQYPDLLIDSPPRPRADCAAAVQDNAQGLMVNQQVAAIAATYLYQIIVQRRLTTFNTNVDLPSLTMRSTPITAVNIARVVESLAQPTMKKTRRKAA